MITLHLFLDLEPLLMGFGPWNQDDGPRAQDDGPWWIEFDPKNQDSVRPHFFCVWKLRFLMG